MLQMCVCQPWIIQGWELTSFLSQTKLLLWPTAIQSLWRTERTKVKWKSHIRIFVKNENNNLIRVCTRRQTLQIWEGTISLWSQNWTTLKVPATSLMNQIATWFDYLLFCSHPLAHRVSRWVSRLGWVIWPKDNLYAWHWYEIIQESEPQFSMFGNGTYAWYPFACVLDSYPNSNYSF